MDPRVRRRLWAVVAFAMLAIFASSARGEQPWGKPSAMDGQLVMEKFLTQKPEEIYRNKDGLFPFYRIVPNGDFLDWYYVTRPGDTREVCVPKGNVLRLTDAVTYLNSVKQVDFPHVDFQNVLNTLYRYISGPVNDAPPWPGQRGQSKPYIMLRTADEKSPTADAYPIGGGDVGIPHPVRLVDPADKQDVFGIPIEDAGKRRYIEASAILPLADSIDYLDGVVKKWPMKASAVRLRAYAQAELGRFDKALADYDAAILIAPNPLYFVERGLLHLRMVRADLAMRDVEAALALDSEFVPAYAARAQIYFESNADDDALRDLQRTIDRKHPTSALCTMLGILNGRRKKFDIAEQDFIDAWALNDSPDERRVALLHLGALREAYPSLARQTRQRENIEKQNPRPARYLGTEYYYDLAKELARPDKLSDFYSERAFARDRFGLFEEADQDFTKALELKKYETELLVGRATTRAKLGKYYEALDDLELVETLDPHHTERVPLVKAKIFLEQKKITEAAVAAEEAVKRNPFDLQAKYVRGEARNKSGDLAGAREDLDQVVAVRSYHAAGVHARAEVATAQKDWLVADGDWSRVIELKPDAEAFHERAKIRAFQLGRSAEAVKDAEQACVLSNNADPKMIETLAEVCAKTGNFTAAYDAQSVACHLYSPGTAAEKLAKKRLGRYLAEQPTDDIER